MNCTISGYAAPAVSGADLSTKRGYCVKTPTAWVLATTDDAVGLLINGGSASGDVCTVVLRGYGKALAGGTVAVGDRLECASGLLQAYTSGTKIATALSAGTSGEMIDVWMEA